ncbi:MAG: VWA domain-containing protein [Mycobacteriales bacterium]
MTGLLDRQVAFLSALRGAGLAVSLAESLDAARAASVVGMSDREVLRAAFAATTLKRQALRPAFDSLFDLYFPIAVGDPVVCEASNSKSSSDKSLEEEQDAATAALRQSLFEALLEGSEAPLAELARRAVAMLGRSGAAGGRQSFFAYRVLRRLSPDTLMASLLEAVLAGRERGGLAEAVARQSLGERIRRFAELVEAEVRRRTAEDKGVAEVARNAVRPVAETVDFLRATGDDLRQLRRDVYPLARRLATRLTARRRLGRAGRLDFRRTVRASLSTGGVPMLTRHRPHRPHRPELAVVCDVSGSVAAFAHFTLLLSYALRDQFARVRAFAFIDTTDEITGFFTGREDVVDAMVRVTREAQLVRYDGHSDYGNAFAVLAERWPDAVGPRTSLLILGDARNNYRSLGLPALSTLVRRARHAYWLNPEPRRYWGSGDSATAAYAEVVQMVECRNSVQLEAFVAGLLR